MPLLLVRHARAGSRSRWKGDDRLRPLTKKGATQAQGLVAVLKPFGPGPILSSPFVRCIQTVEPLARKLALKVEEVDELEEGRGQAAVSLLAELLDLEGWVVACTHGDVVLDALRSLAGPVPAQPPSAKGSVWVLESARDGAPATARYLPAPS